MDFIFFLPVWQGLLISIITSIIIGVLVVLVTRKLIADKLSKQHERIGRLLFRVSAGLIALLISLSYANERVEHNRVRDSLELEASLIANVYIKLGMHNSAEAGNIRKEIIKYVEYIVSDNWESSNSNPYYSEMTNTIINADSLSYGLSEDSKMQTELKKLIIIELNEAVKLMQIRFYATEVLLPYLIYILGAGIFFMWIFFAVYNVDFISMVFLSLYNTFLVILIYFTVMLSNPMVGTLKIEASAFKVLKEKGIDRMKE